MKTENVDIWINGIHGDILDVDNVWKQFQVNSVRAWCNSDHELTEECDKCLRKKYDDFWAKQEYDI